MSPPGLHPLNLHDLEQLLRETLAKNPFLTRATSEFTLRERALTATAEQLGLDPEQTDTDVWLAIVETRYPETVVMLIVMADGTTNLHVSSSGTMLRIRDRPAVQEASRKFLLQAAGITPQCSPVDVMPPPEVGRVMFYLRTRDATLGTDAAEMAPRMNTVISGLRTQGALIIHAPWGCVDFYSGTPARIRAIQAPRTEATVAIDWNSWNGDREASLPPILADPGSCSCDSAEPCCEAGQPYPWTRQISSIEIAPADAVSDNGQEVFNLLKQRGIEDVVVMGVHANICVLSRPYGIRQLVYLGKRPILCRDLTDSFHRDPRGHFWGTDLIIAHIERHWCPTITSDQLVGRAHDRARLTHRLFESLDDDAAEAP